MYIRRMKKLIDIPEEIVKDLKKIAVDENKSLKKFIEDNLVQIVNNSVYRAELSDEEQEYLDRQ